MIDNLSADVDEIELYIQVHKKIKDNVAKILDKFPNARNNDFYLYWLYLKYVEKVPLPFLEYSDIQNLSGLISSIRNMRQQLNRDGQYLPTDPRILKRRRERAEIIKKAIFQI